jgi:hypothetical protein
MEPEGEATTDTQRSAPIQIEDRHMCQFLNEWYEDLKLELRRDMQLPGFELANKARAWQGHLDAVNGAIAVRNVTCRLQRDQRR